MGLAMCMSIYDERKSNFFLKLQKDFTAYPQ